MEPNLVMEFGLHSSLHKNCHHQTICTKFNVKIYYPLPYEREIWHSFTNIDVNEKVNLFNKTIKNIILNYIPHETITCDLRDPPWINEDIKELIHEKNQAYKLYRQNKNNTFSLYQF